MLEGPFRDYCNGQVREMVAQNTAAHVCIAALGKAT